MGIQILFLMSLILNNFNAVLILHQNYQLFGIEMHKVKRNQKGKKKNCIWKTTSKTLVR